MHPARERAAAFALSAVLGACGGGGGGGDGGPGGGVTLPRIDGCHARARVTDDAGRDDVVLLGAHRPERVEMTQVRARGGTAVVCDALEGLRVYDVCDGAPTEVAVLGSVRCVDAVFSGRFVIASSPAQGASGETPLYVYDLSDPASPREATVFRKTGMAYEGLATDGDLLFAAAHQAGVEVFRVTEEGRLRTVSEFYDNVVERNAIDVEVTPDRIYVADGRYGLQVFAREGDDAPRHLGTLPARDGVGGLPGVVTGRAVAAGGGTAYLAMAGDGVGIIDVRDPAHPTWLAHIATPRPAFSIDVQGKHLYVAAWDELRIYDVATPSAPALVATERTRAEFPRVVAVDAADGRLYVAEWKSFNVMHHFDGRSAPDIRLSVGAALPFRRTAAGEAAAHAILVANDGRQPLDVREITIDGSATFTVDVTSLQVAPGAQEVVEVTFAPTGAEAQDAMLHVRSNDPDEPSLGVALSGNHAGLTDGDLAPDFTLPDVSGVTHTLSSYRGQVVVLVFFGVT